MRLQQGRGAAGWWRLHDTHHREEESPAHRRKPAVTETAPTVLRGSNGKLPRKTGRSSVAPTPTTSYTAFHGERECPARSLNIAQVRRRHKRCQSTAGQRPPRSRPSPPRKQTKTARTAIGQHHTSSGGRPRPRPQIPAAPQQSPPGEPGAHSLSLANVIGSRGSPNYGRPTTPQILKRGHLPPPPPRSLLLHNTPGKQRCAVTCSAHLTSSQPTDRPIGHRAPHACLQSASEGNKKNMAAAPGKSTQWVSGHSPQPPTCAGKANGWGRGPQRRGRAVVTAARPQFHRHRRSTVVKAHPHATPRGSAV